MEKHLFVEKPINGNRWAVSGIYGFAKSFETLVTEKLGLSLDDQLFLLGDFIDHGPNSSGVIDFVVGLQQNNYHVYAVRGSHEDFALYKNQMSIKKEDADFEMIGLAEDLKTGANKLKPNYQEFFERLPYYIETDDYYFVNAGFNFRAPDPFKDYGSMLRMRRFNHNPTEKTIVRAYMVTPLAEIKQSIAEKRKVLTIENGAFYGPILKTISAEKVKGFDMDLGKLIAFNLDTHELLVQEIID